MSDNLPNPDNAPELFEGVLTRRVLAYLVDFVFVAIIAFAALLISVVVGVVTFGLGFITLPFVLPIAVLLYYAATLGSPRRATIGMRVFDVVLTPTHGPPLDGWKVLIHPVIFWLTIWVFWPLLLIGLFTARRQLLHDMLTRTLMVRRSPMQRRWAEGRDFAGDRADHSEF